MKSHTLAGSLVALGGLFSSVAPAQPPRLKRRRKRRGLKIVVVDAVTRQPVGSAEISASIAAAVNAMVALHERMGIDLSDAKVSGKHVLGERSRFAQFGYTEGISASSVRVPVEAESSRSDKNGGPLAGTYTMALGGAMRLSEQ